MPVLLAAAQQSPTADLPAPQSGPTGTLRGTVTLADNNAPLHKAIVLIVQLNRSTETNDEGLYEFKNVPPGSYDVVIHVPALTDARKSIQLTAGAISTLDFSMRIAPVHAQITVTASGREETPLETFQSTTTLEAVQLTQNAQSSIGEVLETQAGVAKRSFGPGNSRPVLRGFDGDRVLIMQDGLATGSLSSQSGDHGENLDVMSLERIEIVRGPSTLLYGSNAVGGVVNAISGHQHIYDHAHPGFSGYLTGVGGLGNAQGGASAGIEYGVKSWLLWLGGSGERTGDYRSPQGEIVNSRTRSAGGRSGLGWYGDHGFFSLGYVYDNRRYGVPFAAFLENGPPFDPAAEVTNLRSRKHDVQFSGGLRNLNGPISDVRVSLGYNDYRHGEYEADSLDTDFFNKQLNFRVSFDQKKFKRLTGSFGFSGLYRDYKTAGAEVLAPPTIQNNLALFALQTLDFARLSLQFGGRFEHTGYNAGTLPLQPPYRDRTFNGFSGAAGVRVPLWKGGAFVFNYTHSFRAPALEELYNNGPHAGNLAFEIGNQHLSREKGNGVDLSLRNQSDRLRAEANFFFYKLRDFVFLTPTGNVSSGLFEAEYLQGDTRYLGGEFTADLRLHENLWLTGGFDAVTAELTRPINSTTTGLVTPAGSSLPRIPPFGGRIGLDIRWGGLSVRPEGVFGARQDRIFSTETPTNGYALFHLNASYTIARQHIVHVLSANAFNLTDTLYRNHLSFIKNLAPEIGVGVRFSYTLRFY